MRKLIAMAAFLTLAIPATRAADDDADKATKKLEGTYEVLSATRGGKPDEKGKSVESFTIKGANLTITMEEGKEMKATGYETFILQKFNGKWRIVHSHSSTQRAKSE